MNIALFAADEVGYETVKFFSENDEPLTCLVLDIQDRKALNQNMITVSRLAADRIIPSDRLAEPETLEWLRNQSLDLIILAWWPYIIKENLISIPRLGCLNFHPSLLPYNRGKDPNFWALKDDTPFGVTIHFVTPGIDNGDIVFQSPIATTWEDTGQTLYQKSTSEIVALFRSVFPQIKQGALPRRPQQPEEGSFHLRKHLQAASKIDLDAVYTARELLNLIRARTFPPHPGTWFVEDGKKYEVRIQITEVENGENT